MRTLSIFLSTVLVLATIACAGNNIKTSSDHLAVQGQPVSTPSAVTVTATEPESAPVLVARQSPDVADAASSATHGDAGTAQDIGDVDQDAEAIYGQPLVLDPWEGFNRKIYTFNSAADKVVLRPLAVGYDKITPAPVKKGVSRFFDNLSTPVTAVNQVLQGRPGHAAQSVGRFVVNSTVGIGGIFDPASYFGMEKRGEEDFGQTLATWGWRDSRYLVLPFLGPGTVRDAVSIAGDMPLAPIGRIESSGLADKLRILEIVDGRAQLLPVDKFLQDAFDEYLFVRDAWAQRRNNKILNDIQGGHD